MMAAALKRTTATLGDLLGPAAREHAALEIRDLVLDSRQVTPGAAFVAVAGAREHGARHAAEALRRGASAIVYEPGPEVCDVPEPCVAVPGLKARLGELARAFFDDPAAPVTLAGVTGTNGKTTVAHLIAEAMTGTTGRKPAAATSSAAGNDATSEARGGRCGYIGTLGYGVPPELTEHALTTPDCFTLHRELGALDASRAALEVSSHALAQDRIAGLVFDVAVFTNLSRDHLDEHGDLWTYGEAKARLFRLPGLRAAVVNLNDGFGRSLAATLPRGMPLIGTRLVSDGTAEPRFNELTGLARAHGLRGIEIEVFWRGQHARVASPLVGDFNAENILSALGVLLAWQLPLPEACRRIAACKAPPGRMEVLGGPPRHPWVVVDYAHTPDALERVLALLRIAAPDMLWCVFGCGGERDPGKRALMGEAAARLADHIVLTDDNPRGEDPDAIIADIRAGANGHPRLRVQRDRRAAIREAVRQAGPGDVVLVAGKGHEALQIRGNESQPFSDRAEALEALAALEERRR
jgi:UDP-N-acetylmuramoyl-L-alanyl-D-glutamate--2,6-diaminopimelate ligase